MSAVGGRGGRAQNGGDGAKGITPTTEVLHVQKKGFDLYCRKNTQLLRFVFIHLSHNCYSDVLYNECTNVYDVYGVCPGQGGEGGQGGFGGYPGSVRIFELGEMSGIVKFAAIGPDGSNGRAGEYGPPTSMARMSCLVSEKIFGVMSDVHWTQIYQEKDEYCPTLPRNNTNTKGIVMPTEAVALIDPSVHLIEYLSFAREGQFAKLKRDDILRFVESFSGDENVLADYSLIAFVKELLMLEGQYYSLKDQIDLKKYYYWFASKVEKFVAMWPPISQEELQVFTYLYAASWGKYLTLKTDATFLITDIKSYLDATIRTIEKVDKSRRKQIIDDHRRQYTDQIQSKIDEANSLINDDIRPTITNIKAELKTNMKALVAETVAMRNNIQATINENEEQLKKLSNFMNINLAFGVLDVVSTVASCFGPYGAAASLVISGATQVGKAFMGDKPAFQKAIEIPAGIKTALEGAYEAVNARRDKRIKSLNKQIENIKKNTAGHLDAFGDTLDGLDEIHRRMNATKFDGKNAFKEIAAFENEVTELIEKKKKLMEKSPSKYHKAALKAINGMSSALTVMDAANDVYEQYKSDKDELTAIGDALDASRQSVNDLKEFEQSIYDSMWPMLTDMLADIDDIEQGTKNSHAIIELKKFKIQENLRDTKYILHKFVKGFEAEEDLMQTFKKLDDVYLALTNIYDRIESYRDQSKLGDFISDIASADAQGVQVTDPQLNSALVTLDVIVNSNVLLNQYKSAVDGFKHAVFPFASYYLDAYKLPTGLQLNDFSLLVTEASSRLEGLKTKLQAYNEAMINENDEFIVEAAFISSEPFYEWQFESNDKAITDLLSGKSIKLIADIKQGMQLQNANLQNAKNDCLYVVK